MGIISFDSWKRNSILISSLREEAPGSRIAGPTIRPASLSVGLRFGL